MCIMPPHNMSNSQSRAGLLYKLCFHISFPCPSTDADTLSPVVSPEPQGEMWGHESGSRVEEGEGEEEVDAVRDGSDGMRTSSSDDGLYVKSSMY